MKTDKIKQRTVSEQSHVAIGQSLKLSEKIVAYNTVMSVLGIEDIRGLHDHPLV